MEDDFLLTFSYYLEDEPIGDMQVLLEPDEEDTYQDEDEA